MKNIVLRELNEEKMQLEQMEKSILNEIIQSSLMRQNHDAVRKTYCLKVVEKKLDVVRKMLSLYAKGNVSLELSKNVEALPNEVNFIEVVEDPDKVMKLATLLSGYGKACEQNEDKEIITKIYESKIKILMYDDFSLNSFPYVSSCYEDNLRGILNVFQNVYEKHLNRRISKKTQELIKDDQTDVLKLKKSH